MTVASVYYDVLDAFVTSIQSLALTYQSTPITVQLRKLPTKEETIDSLPLIVVCPHTRADQFRQLSFEDDTGVEGTYYIEIVLVFTGGRDFLTNLDLLLKFREQVRRLFQRPPLVGSGAGAALVWNIMSDNDYVLDQNMIAQNYDYEGLAFWAKTTEPRTN